MRRKFLATFIVCSLAMPVAVNATGIPVLDVAGIAQMVQNATATAQQALDQLNQLKQQYDQAVAAAKAEKERFEGNWSLGDVLNDPTLTSYLPDDWTDIYSSGDVSGLREQYKLKSTNSEVQEQYDSLLSNLSTMQEAYDSTVKRTKNIEQLASYMNSAQTPQQKADYANRILFEQTQIQNEQAKVNAVKTMMEQREYIQNKARQQAFIDRFGDK